MSGQAVRRAGPSTYFVRPGDTLYAIARRFDTTVARLRVLNPRFRHTDLIHPNQPIQLVDISPGTRSRGTSAALSTPSPSVRPSSSVGRSSSLLQAIAVTGAGRRTLRGSGLRSGVGASETLAQRDLRQVRSMQQIFVSVGQDVGLPPALLAGIASRESRLGRVLRSDGWNRSRRDYGVMQISVSNSPVQRPGPRSRAHVSQAAHILVGQLRAVRRRHPTWSQANQLRGAVAAYNFGAGNVRTLARLDIGTANHDYSSDVVARAQYYERAVPGFSQSSISSLPARYV